MTDHDPDDIKRRIQTIAQHPVIHMLRDFLSDLAVLKSAIVLPAEAFVNGTKGAAKAVVRQVGKRLGRRSGLDLESVQVQFDAEDRSKNRTWRSQTEVRNWLEDLFTDHPQLMGSKGSPPGDNMMKTYAGRLFRREPLRQ